MTSDMVHLVDAYNQVTGLAVVFTLIHPSLGYLGCGGVVWATVRPYSNCYVLDVWSEYIPDGFVDWWSQRLWKG